MKKYTNQICPVCKKKFVESDDIVVCPECGCPHHRECFVAIGHCARQEEHGVKENPPKEERRPDSSQTRCPQCGAAHPADALFCSVCGNSFASNDQNPPTPNLPPNISTGYPQTPPFFGAASIGFSPDETIDGIQMTDYAAYVGTNSGYFLPKFQKFAKGKSVSINFCAFLFPAVYYCYRKLYWQGILFFLLNAAVLLGNVAFYLVGSLYSDHTTAFQTVYWVSSSLSILQLMCNLLSGLFANWLYYRKVRKDLQKCQKRKLPPKQYRSYIKKHGSVSHAAATACALLLSILVMIGTYLMLLWI